MVRKRKLSIQSITLENDIAGQITALAIVSPINPYRVCKTLDVAISSVMYFTNFLHKVGILTVEKSSYGKRKKLLYKFDPGGKFWKDYSIYGVKRPDLFKELISTQSYRELFYKVAIQELSELCLYCPAYTGYNQIGVPDERNLEEFKDTFEEMKPKMPRGLIKHLAFRNEQLLRNQLVMFKILGYKDRNIDVRNDFFKFGSKEDKKIARKISKERIPGITENYRISREELEKEALEKIPDFENPIDTEPDYEEITEGLEAEETLKDIMQHDLKEDK